MNTRVWLQYRFHACRGMIASVLSVGQHGTRYANAGDDQVQQLESLSAIHQSSLNLFGGSLGLVQDIQRLGL